MTVPGLIGMVHLLPLPGSPAFTGDVARVVDRALHDANTLVEAGFGAVMVENFGDAPFFASRVEPVTVAAMTRVITEMRTVVSVPVGVNVLRNDALAAVSIAAVTGASMVRVNVLSGSMMTDQGPIIGEAADVARLKVRIAPSLSILADVMVKHATAPPGLTIEQAALDTWERAGATALVVSGSGTGSATSLSDLQTVRKAVPEAPIIVGSGATAETLDELASAADSVIAGTSLKRGDITMPVDRDLAHRFAEAGRLAGFAE